MTRLRDLIAGLSALLVVATLVSCQASPAATLSPGSALSPGQTRGAVPTVADGPSSTRRRGGTQTTAPSSIVAPPSPSGLPSSGPSVTLAPPPTVVPPTEGPPATETATLDLIAQSPNASCAYVPNGNLDGTDSLQVFFFMTLLFAVPSDLDRLVIVEGTTDTGLVARVSSAVGNQAATAIAFSLRPEDFGTTHQVTFVVDADDHYRETDEDNNRIVIDVTLPSPRPDTAIPALTCG